MAEKEVRLPTPDGEMLTFIAHPDTGGPFPLAILFMDGVGYREQVKENSRRFAAAGYLVAAPDLYHRAGDGLSFDMAALTAEGMDGPTGRRLRETAQTVTPDRAAADTEAVLAALGAEPATAGGPAVCVGYCLGARVALHAASRFADRFAAAAGIHPGALVTGQADSPHHDLAAVRGELYFAFAEQDRSATPEVVGRFRAEMERQGVRGVVERLPGTAHGFAMADLAVYNPVAAEHHFERTLDLWERSLRQPAAT